MNNSTTKFFIGTSGWNYPHWKGVFYPDDWPKSRWFEYYARYFTTVEVNATFYRRFKDQTYYNWREKAPEGFRYVLKAPRIITHRKYLKDVDEEIRQFWRSANLLKEKFGLILLQLAPATPYEPGRLKHALNTFGEPSKIAVELRKDVWFTDEVKNLLGKLGSVFCNADSPKTRLNDWLTSSIAYLRLHGRRKWYAYNYSDEELREIAELARGFSERGARCVYIFFNNDFEGYAVKNAITLKEMLAD